MHYFIQNTGREKSTMVKQTADRDNLGDFASKFAELNELLSVCKG